MAAGRLNIPTIVVTAGPMMTGQYGGKRRSFVRDTFEAVGQYQAGKMKGSELTALEMSACPGAGRLHRRTQGPGSNRLWRAAEKSSQWSEGNLLLHRSEDEGYLHQWKSEQCGIERGQADGRLANPGGKERIER